MSEQERATRRAALARAEVKVRQARLRSQDETDAMMADADPASAVILSVHNRAFELGLLAAADILAGEIAELDR